MNNTNTKIALGGIALFIVGIAGGAIYSQPKDNLPVGAGEVVEETVTINDDGVTAKESLKIRIETPTVTILEITVDTANEQIEKIQKLKTAHEGYLATFNASIASAKEGDDISSLLHQQREATNRIQSYNDAIAYYQAILGKVQPELDKLPARVEATPVVDEVVDQPFNPDEGLEGSVN